MTCACGTPTDDPRHDEAHARWREDDFTEARRRVREGQAALRARHRQRQRDNGLGELADLAEERERSLSGWSKRWGRSVDCRVRFSDVFGHNAYVADGVERALHRPARDFATFASAAALTGIWELPVPTSM